MKAIFKKWVAWTSKIEMSKENLELKLPIFKRTLFKILKSKIFIIITSLYFVLFLTTYLMGIYFFLHNDFNQNSFLITWMPFIISISFVTFFEIFAVTYINSSELKDGVMSIEIRSGISKKKIYFERFFSNKIIIFAILFLSFIIFLTFGLLSKNMYVNQNVKNVLPGFLLIFIIDLFVYSLLMLFSFISPSLLGALGIIMGLLFIGSFFINSFSYKFENIKDKKENVKYSLLYEMQQIKNKYGNDSLIKKI